MTDAKRTLPRSLVRDYIFLRVTPFVPPAPPRARTGRVGEFGQAVEDMEAVEESLREMLREARRGLVYRRLL